MSGWLWLAVVAVGAASAAPAVEPETIGPPASVIRPADKPVQVRHAKLPSGVNRRWFQGDCDLIWRVRRALPPDPARATLAALPEDHSTVERVDLGFGMARHAQRAGGGYLSCDATSVTHERALVSMRVACWGSLENVARMRPIIEQALGPAFERDEPEPSSGYVHYRVDYRFP